MIDPTGRPSFSPVRKSYTTQAENQLRERVAMLQTEFVEIDVNHDSWISREELYSYLDRKAGRTFDRAIADDIFDQMDKDHDEKVTINEFIKVYIQADEILRAKIDKARLMKETYKKEEEELTIKAEKAAAYEGFGGAQTGLANVNIREVRLAPELSRFSNLYVEVYLNNQPVAKTRVISTDSSLTWDEKFTFEIPGADSEIKLVLSDRGAFGGGTIIGESSVHVTQLSDQEIHADWIDLFTREQQFPAGKLSIEIQWIYSKMKYFRTLAQRSRENALKADEDVRDYEIMFQKLHEPFVGMQAAHDAHIVQSRYPGLSSTDQQFVSGMNKLVAKFGPADKPSEEIWSTVTIVVAAIEAVVGIMMMFGRASFFDVVFPLVVILYIKQGSLREFISLRIVAFGILGSILLLDFLWVVIFWKNWGLNESQGMDKASHQITWIIILTLVSVVIKIILSILCYMLNIETSMQRGSVKRRMMRNIDYPSAQ